MRTGIFLCYIGLGSNLLHLAYCHEIAKKYGPVSIITICKNLQFALADDPLIKEVIYIENYYKKIFDIFKLSKILRIYNFQYFYIFYPSIRLYLASKIAGIQNVFFYKFLKKKNLHLVKAAQNLVNHELKINSCPTETKFYISKNNFEIAKKTLDTTKINIVIGAGSSGPTTRWGEANYISLIQKLNEIDNFYFYILCGPNESKISDTIINAINKKNCSSLCHKKINELIPIISNSKLYVGNDSFGHHITCQSGIPSIILMLDTPRAYTDYSINQYRIMPEGINENDIKHDSRFNSKSIKVEKVYKKVLSLLS